MALNWIKRKRGKSFISVKYEYQTQRVKAPQWQHNSGKDKRKGLTKTTGVTGQQKEEFKIR